MSDELDRSAVSDTLCELIAHSARLMQMLHESHRREGALFSYATSIKSIAEKVEETIRKAA